MPRQHNPPKGSKGGARPPRGAISKAPTKVSKLGAAISAASGAKASASSLGLQGLASPSASLCLQGLASPNAALAADLTKLVCECLERAPSSGLGLPELGSAIRELEKRRCNTEAEGKLSRRLKEAWGGWAGFAAAHGAGKFELHDGVMRIPRPAPGHTGSAGRAAQQQDRRSSPPPSTDDLSLTLSSLLGSSRAEGS